ncbi:LysR family transcriptional regulator [Halomonas sp. MCCC 1A17488]|uniref:LysR family transcriptional regulator n=1 Tax=Billgrantia sulfidoxydans TaxID=2733484 RepID=A0ABX7VXS2_9GAMM|nr:MULTISPECIES: LysR family transcriptional regulator [Halomonas]MCE8017165.1 LysR family transcriptional regulator [Halomonas sp. MCCC 1A17488]MCG3240498.1 LysR family transcriptional regulator [Halomonas sp. MCCC 1A17488]QPP49645.1 LysR family transcriptional regulator [Halomonas sp. SS10-MC5]QTP53254.1 LysR family transcriptional regulator [Halomonas sulfidoxydans]
MDRIDAMRAFVTVVSEGSFTRAAERLELSPQLVSKYVSQLEQRLGVRLLNRTTRKSHLTEAGARLYPRAQQLLNDVDDMEHQLGDLQTQARGRLRISAPVSFAIRHLAPLLSDFQRAHPAVGIDLQLNDRKVDIVEEGFDVALRIGHLKSSSLIAKRIAPIRLVLCASPEYLKRYGTPRCPEDLEAHRYLRYSYMEQEAGESLLRWLPGHDPQRGDQVNSDFISNNGDVLVEAAIAGGGLALQPTFISGSAIKEGKLQVILAEHEPEPMSLYAVYAHRQLLASKVRCFVDFLDGYFGDPPHWDRFD